MRTYLTRTEAFERGWRCAECHQKGLPESKAHWINSVRGAFSYPPSVNIAKAFRDGFSACRLNAKERR
jgi:hypothetical protein